MYTPYKCKTCLKGYSTNSHLRRHEASHNIGRSHACFFCDQYFSRIDTARRHAKKCPLRGDRPMPRNLKRGKPRTSCDYCASVKIACDENSPCGTCLSSSSKCTYSRVSDISLSTSPQLRNISSPANEDNAGAIMERQISPLTQESTHNSRKVKIPFLLSFYRESNSCRDYYTALECGRPEPSQRCRSPTQSSEAEVIPSDLVQASLNEESLPGLSFFGFPGIDSWSDEALGHAISENVPEPQFLGFRERSIEIVHELRLVANNSKISTERTRDSLNSAIGQGLFSVFNLIEYTQLYLRCFHRHCPIIELPTSRIPFVSLPLLLAIFLGGSLLSYPRDTHHLAIECFDLAEEYIFGLPIFQTGRKDTRPSDNRLPYLAEPLMAAIIMINLQVGRNDSFTRHRIIEERFPALVYAARSLSLFKMNHQHTSLELVPFKEKESLIRTATYIFLLDCQFLACFQALPLIQTAEITGDLPCGEVQFSTKGSLRSTVGPHERSPSLINVINILMEDSQEDLDKILIHNVSVFGLFAVICGLHSTISSALATRTIFHQNFQLRRALNRWHLLWKTSTARITKEELGLIGFMMCGEEIWLLAKAFLRTHSENFVMGLDCDSMVPLESLLNQVHEMSNGPDGHRMK